VQISKTNLRVHIVHPTRFIAVVDDRVSRAKCDAMANLIALMEVMRRIAVSYFYDWGLYVNLVTLY
jgi:hypothetical protein